MALNWTMLGPDRTPVPLPHEMTIMTVDSGAEVTLIIPDAPHAGSAAAGGAGGAQRLKDVGRIWLTDKRLIFVGPPSNDAFSSLSIPLPSILSTSFEQPYFGANYLAFEVRPSPDGGLSPGTRAELRFKDRGMFEFVSLLEKTRERAIYMKRQAESEADTLPLYEGSEANSAEPSGAATPLVNPEPGELPPGYEA